MKDQDKDNRYDTGASGNGQHQSAKQPNRTEDDEFPGYPHYPASEDIMNSDSGARKVSTDPDEINRANAYSANHGRDSDEKPVSPLQEEDETEDDLIIVSGTEADVTEEDLLILGPKDQDMDMGDDELIRGKLDPIGVTDDGLDIPEDDIDEGADEAVSEDDEENSYYSLGGDRHEDLEEDNQQ